jgi:hypothetical protein
MSRFDDNKIKGPEGISENEVFSAIFGVSCVMHDRFVLHGLILICYVTPLSVYIGPYPHKLDFVHLLKKGMHILIII